MPARNTTDNKLIQPLGGEGDNMNERMAEFLTSEDKTRTFRRIDGIYAPFSKNELVGYCHCDLHKGSLSSRDMEKHQCISKGCCYFEKYEEFPYWQRKKRHDENVAAFKRKRQAKQEKAEAQKRRLDTLRMSAQEISGRLGYDITVMSVTELSPKAYAVFYISDKPYNDWYLYKDLSISLFHTYGRFFELRHIKDVNGEYAVSSDISKR